jgi:hypothetical protein
MSYRPSWLGGTDDDEEKKKQEAAAKKQREDEIAAAVKAATDPIVEKLKGLDSISNLAAEMKTEREANKKKEEDAEAERQRKASGGNAPTDEELAKLMETDPKRAVAYLTQGQRELTLRNSAQLVKASVFTDRSDEFPYYTGEIKAEVDKVIGEQNLQFQNDPVAVANAYYTVIGRKQKDITDGKIKSRFASTSGTTGTGGTGGGNQGEEFKLEVTDEMRKAARLSGIPIDDYMKMAEKAAKAGELEYV